MANPSKEISCAFCTASALRYVRNLELRGLIAGGRLIIQTGLALMCFVKSLTPYMPFKEEYSRMLRCVVSLGRNEFSAEFHAEPIIP